MMAAVTVHAFVDESARPPQYLIAAAIVEPSQVRLLRDIHDERTLRRLLGSHPSASRLVYEHVDSTSESLLWIADIVGWCFGAGREWRKRIDPIVTAVVDVE